ncbi:hypothetical protein FRC10_010290 [Ceratobasidium sp. 414]|nr:hypothetical protein FRC10_010290 [Ceratobasidium sp. 414]
MDAYNLPAPESDADPHTEGRTGDSGDDDDDGDGGGGENEDGSGSEDGGRSETDSEAEAESSKDSDEDSDVDEYADDQSIRDDDDAMDIGADLPAPPSPIDTTMSDPDDRVQLQEVVDAYGNKVYIEQYPCPTVGEPIRMEPVQDAPRRGYPDVGQLSKPDAFELGRLIMRSGVSARFRNSYLSLKRLRGMMPWKNNRELITNVGKLPHGPDWSVQAMSIDRSKGTEVVEFWGRNAMDAVKSMVGNKQLGPHMAWKPVRKWKTVERKERIRDEAFTADFMWQTQDKIKDHMRPSLVALSRPTRQS